MLYCFLKQKNIQELNNKIRVLFIYPSLPQKKVSAHICTHDTHDCLESLWHGGFVVSTFALKFLG